MSDRHLFEMQDEGTTRAYDGAWTWRDVVTDHLPDEYDELQDELDEMTSEIEDPEEQDWERATEIQQRQQEIVSETRDELDFTQAVEDAGVPYLKWRDPTGKEALAFERLQDQYRSERRRLKRDIEDELRDELEADAKRQIRREGDDEEVDLDEVADRVDTAIQVQVNQRFYPSDSLRDSIIDWARRITVGVSGVDMPTEGGSEPMRWDDDEWLEDVTGADAQTVRNSFLSSMGDTAQQKISAPIDYASWVYATSGLTENQKKS